MNPHLFVLVFADARLELLQQLLCAPIPTELLNGLIMFIFKDLNLLYLSDRLHYTQVAPSFDVIADRGLLGYCG